MVPSLLLLRLALVFLHSYSSLGRRGRGRGRRKAAEEGEEEAAPAAAPAYDYGNAYGYAAAAPALRKLHIQLCCLRITNRVGYAFPHSAGKQIRNTFPFGEFSCLQKADLHMFTGLADL